MKSFILTQRIHHPFMKADLVDSLELVAPDFMSATCMLKMRGKHIRSIRNTGETSWIDEKDSTITVTLKEKEIHGEPRPDDASDRPDHECSARSIHNG